MIVLLSAADGAYEAARRITRMRLRVSGTDAAMGGFALREAGLRVAGPAARDIPGFPTLVALGIIGGLAAPSLRRTAQRMRAGEQRLRAAEARIRRERIARYVAAQESRAGERGVAAGAGLGLTGPRLRGGLPFPCAVSGVSDIVGFGAAIAHRAGPQPPRAWWWGMRRLFVAMITLGLPIASVVRPGWAVWPWPGPAVVEGVVWLIALTVPAMAVAFLIGLMRWWMYVGASLRRLATMEPGSTSTPCRPAWD